MFVPLFVTADNPLEMINEVLALGDTGHVRRFFKLVESPEQQWDDRDTTLPVKDFKTGFSSWSVPDLGEHLQARFEQLDPEQRKDYDCTTIIVLDEHSIRDRTIALGSHTNAKKEIPEDPDSVEPEWQSVRVRFEDIMDSVPCATLKEFLFFGLKSVRFVNADGIWIPP